MRKGTDWITLDMLEELGACEEGQEFFAEHHPNGEEYQKVLDTACEFDHQEYAIWLLGELGPTDDIWEVESIDTKKEIVFAGGISAGREITAGWGITAREEITAGREITAGWGITARWGITAGWGITAREEISAGENYGIYAGLSARLSDSKCRTVTAKKRPVNLMCGEFVEVGHES